MEVVYDGRVYFAQIAFVEDDGKAEHFTPVAGTRRGLRGKPSQSPGARCPAGVLLKRTVTIS